MKLQELFRSFIGKNEILSIFCNPQDEYNTVVGYANQIDEDYFICDEVSICGKYDGYLLRKTENIFRIDCGTYYELCLQKVFVRESVRHKRIPDHGNVLVNFLQFAKDSGFVVSVGVRVYDSNSVSGYIDNIDIGSETFSVHSILKEKEGGFDGYTTINFADVYRMCCDTEDDNYLKLLNEIATSN